jgi:hypothetical protein
MALFERLVDITHLGTAVIISGAAADAQDWTHQKRCCIRAQSSSAPMLRWLQTGAQAMIS